MRFSSALLIFSLVFGIANTAIAHDITKINSAQLGPRPFYLVDKLDDGGLRHSLQQCAAKKKIYRPTDFSIGHRGAALQFPEHTVESYTAAARMGAGILECDVTFTKDAELVCRHAQCDLHTTTNILATDLADTCEEPFQPAEFDADGNLIKPASAKCCASDLSLEEFKSLEGKMDAFDPRAETVEEYLGGTANWRTDLYATGGTLLSHKESIKLFRKLGTGYTPELKEGDAERIEEVFGGQQEYARKMIEEYIALGVNPGRVWAQSFNFEDVKFWIDAYPRFGDQAVFLDGRSVPGLAETPPPLSEFLELKDMGLNIMAPPMPVLLTTNGENEIVPSVYAERAREAGLDIISWTTERSGRIVEDVLEGGGTFYYQTTLDGLLNDGAILETIHVLAQDVGIIGLFSDWPATTTFYANCKPVNKGASAHPKRHRINGFHHHRRAN